jgi:hypothetical protein
MNTNTNISFRHDAVQYCPGRWPPSERVQKDGHWTIRFVPFPRRPPTDVKTDGSGAGLDQTLIKVW